MKSSLHFLLILPIALLVGGSPAVVEASMAKPVTELLEQLAKQAGKAPSRAAGEALEAAFRLHGDLALDAARHGGLGLAEAAARHGDDVFRMAREVPAAAPALAAHADTLLPLARRYGNPVLEIATHAPGLADDAARLYPSARELARLSKLPPDQARRVIEFAHHAKDRRAGEVLLRETERTGGEILRWLDPQRILAGGLSVAMIRMAGGAADAARNSPEGFFAAGKDLAMPVSIAVAAVVLLWGAMIGRRFGWGRAPSGKG